MIDQEYDDRLRHDIGRHKGRCEALSGHGAYELTLDDPVMEAARMKGWREAEADPTKYRLDVEMRLFQKASNEFVALRTEEGP